jgi:hypothetical protein
MVLTDCVNLIKEAGLKPVENEFSVIRTFPENKNMSSTFIDDSLIIGKNTGELVVYKFN